MIIDIDGAHNAISDVVYMGSPVIIKLFTKKVSEQVHEKFGICNMHSRDITLLIVLL